MSTSLEILAQEKCAQCLHLLHSFSCCDAPHQLIFTGRRSGGGGWGGGRRQQGGGAGRWRRRGWGRWGWGGGGGGSERNRSGPGSMWAASCPARRPCFRDAARPPADPGLGRANPTPPRTAGPAIPPPTLKIIMHLRRTRSYLAENMSCPPDPNKCYFAPNFERVTLRQRLRSRSPPTLILDPLQHVMY